MTTMPSTAALAAQARRIDAVKHLGERIVEWREKERRYQQRLAAAEVGEQVLKDKVDYLELELVKAHNQIEYWRRKAEGRDA